MYVKEYISATHTLVFFKYHQRYIAKIYLNLWICLSNKLFNAFSMLFANFVLSMQIVDNLWFEINTVCETKTNDFKYFAGLTFYWCYESDDI